MLTQAPCLEYLSPRFVQPRRANWTLGYANILRETPAARQALTGVFSQEARAMFT
jgi:hypothetical protein